MTGHIVCRAVPCVWRGSQPAWRRGRLAPGCPDWLLCPLSSLGSSASLSPLPSLRWAAHWSHSGPTLSWS